MPSDLYSVYAGLYDAAFDWDVLHQVEAIGASSGLTKGRVLEPMCGSGRLCREFAKQGFATVGIDSSEQMLAIAAAHYDHAGVKGEWICADVTDFRIDQACDLAVCPINSLQHLASVAAMGSHLEAVSRSVYSNSSYWIQLDLWSGDSAGGAEEWEFEYLDETVRCEWASSAQHDGFETHVLRFVFPGGRIIEDEQEMKLWRYDEWTAILDASPFQLTGAYTGDDFTPIALDSSLEGQHVIWQQLIKL
ncbi:MAG: class I SAM-dependent methyltransferase [Gammaproteobacteria bacterium]|nr:class I SAM-dependent methyltransferase [Gammaproteobacteria bacterium]